MFWVLSMCNILWRVYQFLDNNREINIYTTAAAWQWLSNEFVLNPNRRERNTGTVFCTLSMAWCHKQYSWNIVLVMGRSLAGKNVDTEEEDMLISVNKQWPVKTQETERTYTGCRELLIAWISEGAMVSSRYDLSEIVNPITKSNPVYSHFIHARIDYICILIVNWLFYVIYCSSMSVVILYLILLVCWFYCGAAWSCSECIV
jgi:hypothetical protein